MKTKFKLERTDVVGFKDDGFINIIGTRPKHSPYVSIIIGDPIDAEPRFIKDNELELLAVNILKALKSKHLKP